MNTQLFNFSQLNDAERADKETLFDVLCETKRDWESAESEYRAEGLTPDDLLRQRFNDRNGVAVGATPSSEVESAGGVGIVARETLSGKPAPPDRLGVGSNEFLSDGQ